MKGRLGRERGMSLIEATIILMVLSILTAVIAPSAGDYIEEARNTKAKEDVEAIGTAILRVLRDTGLSCLSDAPPACTASARVDLLLSGGTSPTVSTGSYAAPASTTSAANLNWNGHADAITNSDDMVDQLVTNAAGYTDVVFTGGGGPRAGVGWRGAYLQGPIESDPWGYKYQANTVFLAVASDANGGTGHGQRSGGWRNDVFVISSGSNGTMQTAIANDGVDGTSAVGDDVVYVVTGASR